MARIGRERAVRFATAELIAMPTILIFCLILLAWGDPCLSHDYITGTIGNPGTSTNGSNAFVRFFALWPHHGPDAAQAHQPAVRGRRYSQSDRVASRGAILGRARWVRACMRYTGLRSKLAAEGACF